MSNNTVLLIRADAAPRMGTGHVMRCLALAQAALDEGLDVRMLCRANVGWLRERLEKECIPLHVLPDAPPAAEDPKALLRQLQQGGLPEAAGTDTPAWVVLDGYHFDAACQKAVMDAGHRLLVIDDYAHFPAYQCHVLLNQNPGAETLGYGGSIGRRLLGPKYALLRREFAAARESAVPRVPPAQPENILVTLGGGDFSDALEGIGAHMTGAELAGRTIRVIQGAMDAERVRAAFAKCPARLEILPRVDDMAALLLDTDLCITAGGSTCWELCCLGVPFLTVEVAENQREICAWLEKNGIAPRVSTVAVRERLSGGNTVPGPVVQGLVDGIGALRVVRCMQNAQAASGPGPRARRMLPLGAGQ